ncbi:MAG: hypothetical protein ACRD0P_23630, partial [Stackebrandtia sp.]
GSRPISEAQAAQWWAHFHSAIVGRTAWGGEYVPVFQTDNVAVARVLLHEPGGLYPDLSGLRVEVADADGRPALVFHSVHPFVTGFQLSHAHGVTIELAPGDAWPLPFDSGEHTVQVAARSDYGVLTAQPLRYRGA